MKYLHCLNLIQGVGAQKLRSLVSAFGSGEMIWNASLTELATAGIGEKLALKIVEERAALDPDQEWQRLEKAGISLCPFDSPSFPSLLREMNNPPHLVYIRGSVDFISLPLVAVVGSRKLTAYGKQAAYQLSRDLASAGVGVVSGLAMGIDAAAHQGAVDAKGITVAVLGGGLDDAGIAPGINLGLAHRILENRGTLLSETAMGAPANPGAFPMRNRIMAGMTLGTLVIEAAAESGSLITANLALDFNREVFSVPGPIFSAQSDGTNELIRKGAKLVRSAKDILEELRIPERIQHQTARQTLSNDPEEQKVLTVLTREPLHIDTITKLTKLNTSCISSLLVVMEMKGLVKNVGGQNYVQL